MKKGCDAAEKKTREEGRGIVLKATAGGGFTDAQGIQKMERPANTARKESATGCTGSWGMVSVKQGKENKVLLSASCNSKQMSTNTGVTLRSGTSLKYLRPNNVPHSSFLLARFGHSRLLSGARGRKHFTTP